ncbi:MAG TPA: response regulator transcription factor [Candidatus Obscuribacterales bacterium]
MHIEGGPITIFICEDEQIAGAGLQYVLEQVPEFDVVGLASDLEGAVAKIAEMRPAVVLMKFTLAGEHRVEAVRALLSNWPDAHVILRVSSNDPHDVFQAIATAAYGVCDTETPIDMLILGIRCVAGGSVWMGPAIAASAVDSLSAVARRWLSESRYFLTGLLSVREQEVLALMLEGLSNLQIADRLLLSVETVKSHVKRIMEKLGARNRSEAIVKAMSLKH